MIQKLQSFDVQKIGQILCMKKVPFANPVTNNINIQYKYSQQHMVTILTHSIDYLSTKISLWLENLEVVNHRFSRKDATKWKYCNENSSVRLSHTVESSSWLKVIMHSVQFS